MDTRATSKKVVQLLSLLALNRSLPIGKEFEFIRPKSQ